jgi:hypothetical protein
MLSLSRPESHATFKVNGHTLACPALLDKATLQIKFFSEPSKTLSNTADQQLKTLADSATDG